MNARQAAEHGRADAISAARHGQFTERELASEDAFLQAMGEIDENARQYAGHVSYGFANSPNSESLFDAYDEAYSRQAVKLFRERQRSPLGRMNPKSYGVRMTRRLQHRVEGELRRRGVQFDELQQRVRSRYEVLVGNIGSVYHGNDHHKALNTFHAYVGMSQTGYGRAAGESVTFFCDGEIEREFQGTVQD